MWGGSRTSGKADLCLLTSHVTSHKARGLLVLCAGGVWLCSELMGLMGAHGGSEPPVCLNGFLPRSQPGMFPSVPYPWAPGQQEAVSEWTLKHLLPMSLVPLCSSIGGKGIILRKFLSGTLESQTPSLRKGSRSVLNLLTCLLSVHLPWACLRPCGPSALPQC